MTPTPDELRTLIVRYGLAAMIAEEDADLGYAAADAWEADIKWRDAMLEYFDVECAALRQRLEAAEFAAHMLHGHYEAKRRNHCEDCNRAYERMTALAGKDPA